MNPEYLLQELQSAVDILVATPGRLMDHINATKGFNLEHLCYLVNCICLLTITYMNILCSSHFYFIQNLIV